MGLKEQRRMYESVEKGKGRGKLCNYIVISEIKEILTTTFKIKSTFIKDW